jgi:hypothetical protein
MHFINRTVNTVFDAWLWPFQGLSATWQIIITALPVTVFALLVFRFASNQDGINAVKNKIKAYLLELWLYKDDLGILFRAQGQVIRYSAIYLRYALVPLLIMIVPLALVIVQLESLYAFRGLDPGPCLRAWFKRRRRCEFARRARYCGGFVAQRPVNMQR